MVRSRSLFEIIVGALVFSAMLLAGSYIIPWKNVSWGEIGLIAGRTITVTGEAESKERNQAATFTAGVTVTGDDKDLAVKEVNGKIEALTGSIKNFGISADDIKTQNISIYQREQTYYDEQGSQKAKPGQWSISNSIEIKLRNVERASDLTDILTKSGATNVYGPSFSLEDVKDIEEKLLSQAIDDAKKKAGIMAEASSRKLGKILSVTEGSGSYQIIRPFALEGGGGGGGAPVEPGTGTVRKTVTVVFEID